jgi:hypothetical protein
MLALLLALLSLQVPPMPAGDQSQAISHLNLPIRRVSFPTRQAPYMRINRDAPPCKVTDAHRTCASVYGIDPATDRGVRAKVILRTAVDGGRTKTLDLNGFAQWEVSKGEVLDFQITYLPDGYDQSLKKVFTKFALAKIDPNCCAGMVIWEMAKR